MENKTEMKRRDSNLELFRIIVMLTIVAHHYVVNSGVINIILENNITSLKSIFLLIFGMGGKIGINCFILITGYFMCKSNISIKKFIKLLLEIEFYNIIIYLIFLLVGYVPFSWKDLFYKIFPISSISDSFTPTYLTFFLFIPFLNILIHYMNEKQHRNLLLLCITIFSILPSLSINVTFNYVEWFMIVYLVAAYIRLYENKILNKLTICKWREGICLLTIIVCVFSVIVGAYATKILNRSLFYYFVVDCNKFLSLITSVCAFLFFKNLKMKYHKWINTIAASAFGVFLIHANSDAMRRWLWQDVFNNVAMYNSDYLLLYAVGTVLIIYVICTCIDWFRIQLFEKKVLKFLDRKIFDKKIGYN